MMNCCYAGHVRSHGVSHDHLFFTKNMCRACMSLALKQR